MTIHQERTKAKTMEKQIVYFNCRNAKPGDCLGAIVINGKPYDVILMDNVRGKVTTSPTGDRVYVKLLGERNPEIGLKGKEYYINPIDSGLSEVEGYRVEARYVHRIVSHLIPSVKIFVYEGSSITQYKEV